MSWALARVGLVASILLLATSLAAGSFELGLPIACKPGLDCWVIRYADHAPDDGFADYACGRLGSNGHDGTDFGLRDARAMLEGVAVQAVAAGVVKAVRDGMPDQPADGNLAFDFKDRNCGNGVLISHADGWQTQYCHLHPGSLAVSPGENVLAGQRLGLVGMSGEANFPHVHLSLRHDGQSIDPFNDTPMNAACGTEGHPLWQPSLRSQLAYVGVPIVSVGLADHVPAHGEIVAGDAMNESLAPDRPLVAYLLAYGLATGDRIALEIAGPDGGKVATLDFQVDDDSPRLSRSGGRKAPTQGWPPGLYHVRATVSRGQTTWSLDGSRSLNER
ncbi:Peptidase family M23 [Arboricoccus pini]|uniref:Peptidase family M23 n=1 Tax=Arboricoccus pini TaxID=1963835 RepID=A0A212QUW6_9PROT|nr:M23 family metallopeptidase [Arboricoccus pini]SNB63290.1 Peptidase family M23 [Arboricoccus pini]